MMDRDENSPSQKNERWAKNTLRDVLFEAYREQRRARIWRNIWRGVLLFLVVAIIAGNMNSKRSDKGDIATFAGASKAHTAVIQLNGVIGGDSYRDQVEMLREGMKKAYANSHAKGIVILANSPGGSPVVSNTAFEEIRRMKKENPHIPVYVVVQDMCASGCYYIAAAADKIYADASSIVGSIGVIGSGFDATGLMEKLGIKRRVRIAGENKGMGDPFVPETPQQRQIWQHMLDQIHTEFIKAVRLRRGKQLQEKQYPDLYSGRIFTGIEAKKAGLIDDFGNVYSVAREVVQAPELVDYTQDNNDFMSLVSRRLGAQVEAYVQEKTQNFW